MLLYCYLTAECNTINTQLEKRGILSCTIYYKKLTLDHEYRTYKEKLQGMYVPESIVSKYEIK